jgi:hypothetical protein
MKLLELVIYIGKGLRAADNVTDSAKNINKSLGALSKATSGNTIANIQKAQNFANQFATSTMLTQAESISSATDVWQETYDNALDRGLNVEEAKQVASQAAARTINENRANIALNMTSSLRFLSKPGNASKLLRKDSFTKGFWGQAKKGDKWWKKPGNFLKGNEEYQIP